MARGEGRGHLDDKGLANFWQKLKEKKETDVGRAGVEIMTIFLQHSELFIELKNTDYVFIKSLR